MLTEFVRRIVEFDRSTTFDSADCRLNSKLSRTVSGNIVEAVVILNTVLVTEQRRVKLNCFPIYPLIATILVLNDKANFKIFYRVELCFTSVAVRKCKVDKQPVIIVVSVYIACTFALSRNIGVAGFGVVPVAAGLTEVDHGRGV